MNAVCVYCGSGHGTRSAYGDQARALGAAAARRGLRVVYGGANVGLMGVLADATLAAGGEVEGVIPRRLADRELAHTGITRLHLVDTMLQRKEQMAELADAFIALPGGIGTLDELFETMTWTQLGIHHKPSGLLDVEGYWSPLVAMLDRQVEEGFLRRPWQELLSVTDSAEALLDTLVNATPRAGG